MDSFASMLVDELDALGIPCTDDQAALLLKHLGLVIETNKTTNLTRIDTFGDGIYLHLIDSVICSQSIAALPHHGRILDLGTGGGFPGIPLAVMLGSNVTLLDSIGKKVSAVASFIHELGLDDRCQAICSRSEELALMQPSSFDVVVARAVAQTNVLVEYAAPLLNDGGTLCTWKANIDDAELVAAERAADICGMRIVSRETYELPKGYGHREIIYIEKNGEPKIKLPRRNGMATKRPLGL
ncbi:MAG: 16S rRNA (guanine(527)-N(7))-methyltransferase RsmG [Coriobacteriaceae bacterium]|nr:16S rRNA (guanine(527)-N(7))-methyltransferase RsmG [Coriobacteriaceae bacterium]